MESSVICGICKNLFTDIEEVTKHMALHIKVKRCSECDEYFPQIPSTYEHHCTAIHGDTHPPALTNSMCSQSISTNAKKDKTEFQRDKPQDQELQHLRIERQKEAEMCHLKSGSDSYISQEGIERCHPVRNEFSEWHVYTEWSEIKTLKSEVTIKENSCKRDVETKDEKESAAKDKSVTTGPDTRESKMSSDAAREINIPIACYRQALVSVADNGVHTEKKVYRQNDQWTSEEDVEDSDESDENDTHCKGKTVADNTTVNSSRGKTDSNHGEEKCPCLNSSDENVEDEHTEDSVGKTEELKCQICGKDFNSSRARKVHQATHPVGFVSDCEVCGKHFKNGSNLARHMQMHRGEKPFRCKICGKQYADQKTLLIHERVHTGERPHRCNKCGKRFSNPKSYRYHMKQYAGKRIRCETCAKTFASLANLSVHMRTHGNKEFMCDICDKGFHQLGNLSRHQKTHFKDGDETEMIMKLSVHDANYAKSTHICLKNRLSHENSKTLDLEKEKCESENVDRNVKTRSSTQKRQVTRSMHQRKWKKTAGSMLLCGVCNKSFTDYSSLKNHIELHITPEVINCEKADTANLNLHLEHEEKQKTTAFKCKICRIFFTQQIYLSKHMSIHFRTRGKNSHECMTCGKEILEGTESHQCNSCKKASNNHSYSDKAARDNSLSGIIVGDTSGDHGDQSDSWKTNPGKCRRKYKKAPKNRICEICNKAYSSVKRLKLHRQEHDSPPEAIYTCECCGKSFNRLSGLTRHKKSHAKPAVFPCKYCQKKFSCKSKQEIHTRNHTGERPYKCGDCEKTFTAKSGYHQHRQLHELGKVHCQVCSKILTNKSYLKRHMRIHTQEKPYKCQICGEAFYMYGTYRNHRLAHQGIPPKVYSKKEPATCEVCGKYFRSKYYLISHMRLHTGEKPYVCDICGRGFVQSHGLQRHLQFHEKEKTRPEKQFQCEVCHNFYNNLKNLQRHMIYHNRERNCKCQLCPKSYVRPSHLKRHMIDTHKMNLKTSQKPTSMSQPGPASLSKTQTQTVSHALLPLLEPVSVPTFVAPVTAGSSSLSQDLVPVPSAPELPPDPVVPVSVTNHQQYLQTNDSLHIHTMEAAMFNYVSPPQGGDILFS